MHREQLQLREADALAGHTGRHTNTKVTQGRVDVLMGGWATTADTLTWSSTSSRRMSRATAPTEAAPLCVGMGMGSEVRATPVMCDMKGIQQRDAGTPCARSLEQWHEVHRSEVKKRA
jgi:hypothetical protein